MRKPLPSFCNNTLTNMRNIEPHTDIFLNACLWNAAA